MIEGVETPAMVVRDTIEEPDTHLVVRRAASQHDFDVFGRVAEAGYGAPGLAWLQQNQGGYEDERIIWAVVFDGDEPIATACGFVDSSADESTGGIFFVATPPEHRGRGAASQATCWIANRLFDLGAKAVTLQSSEMGFRAYERLGFQPYDSYHRVAMATDANPPSPPLAQP